jgi:hypothetical protein
MQSITSPMPLIGNLGDTKKMLERQSRGSSFLAELFELFLRRHRSPSPVSPLETLAMSGAPEYSQSKSIPSRLSFFYKNGNIWPKAVVALP